jgi:cysteinyl-tRNA synthetase
MHNGFVQIDHEKMSKSLGNFFTIREILKNDQNPERAGEVVRFLMLLSHYRSPLNFSDGGLDQARAGLERLYSALQKSTTGDLPTTPPVNDQFALTFDRALDDDFNTPSAIAVLFDIAKEINRAIDQGKRSLAAAYGVELKRLADILGLLYLNPTVFLGISGSNHPSGAEGESSLIESLIQQRQAARLSRDFDRADAIRGELEALNVLIEDRPDGTCEWRRR